MHKLRGVAGILATSIAATVAMGALAFGVTSNQALTGPGSATVNSSSAIYVPAAAPSPSASTSHYLASVGGVTVVAHPVLARMPVQLYRVRPGDSLSAIAGKKYGKAADWPMIYWANKTTVKYANIIYVGQKLRIPAPYRYRPVPQKEMAPAAPVTITVAATVHGITQQRPAPAPALSGSIQSYVDEVYGSDAGCADELLNHESGLSWSDVTIENPTSGAYGLPQALPGWKMESAGSDWATDPLTQLRWQLGYVDSVYGGICNAAYHDIHDGTY